MHILWQKKNHFNITSAKSEIKKLKSGYLELRFSVLICIVLRREKLILQTKDGAVLRVYEINVMT